MKEVEFKTSLPFQPNSPEIPLSSGQPTQVRYQVLAFLAAMTFILYLDRVCIAQANESIKEELGLSNSAMGFVFGAFTLAYGLFEVVTGGLGDRYGSRGVLMRIVLWWSVFTALTGAVFGFWMLIVVRFLFGAGEAGALPNAARVLRQWFPDSARGTAQGMVTTAMMIGGAVAPVASAYLIKLLGWRLTFLCFGVLGALWAVVFYWWFRDNPVSHPKVNSAEKQLIQMGRSAHEQASAHSPIPWGLVLSSANVWLMGGLMNCASAVFYMLISWYPTYLQSARGAGKIESGWLASLALAGGAVGCVLGGRLTDLIMKYTGSSRRSRCSLGAMAFAGGAIFLLASIYCDSLPLSAVLVALAFMCLQSQLPAWWGTVTQISGRHVGAMFGLMNSLGIVGAVASQLFLGSLADWLESLGYSGRDQWDPGFYVYVGIMGIGSILWYFVRPEKSIVEPETVTHLQEG